MAEKKAKKRFVWVVKYRENGIIIATDHYTMISKVNLLVHLLVHAGYDDSTNVEGLQIWDDTDRFTGVKKSFVIERLYPDMELLKHKI